MTSTCIVPPTSERRHNHDFDTWTDYNIDYTSIVSNHKFLYCILFYLNSSKFVLVVVVILKLKTTDRC